MGALTPTIVLIVDKPYTTTRITDAVRGRWPSHRVLAVHLMSMGLHEFFYPRGLPIAAYPLAIEPQWRPRQNRPRITLLEGEGWARQVGDAASALAAADQIVYVGPPESREVAACDVLLRESASPGVRSRMTEAVFLYSMDAPSLDRAFGAPVEVASEDYQGRLRRGLAKHFFDFNFNANGLVFLGRALDSSGAPEGSHVSKYGLQLLYALRGACAATEAELLERMREWRGTGRYGPVPLGSPSSQWAIIEGLIRSRLLAAQSAVKPLRFALTATGERFLEQLHPDCEDADLPARLGEWVGNWPESRANMERYLRTFFGKQKRFIRPD